MPFPPGLRPFATAVAAASAAAATLFVGAAPAGAAGSVAIQHVTYNSPGADTGSNASRNAETVTVVNSSSRAFSLRGWTLREGARGLTYTFGSRRLAPGGRLTLHSGSGKNTSTDVFWGSRSYVWDNLADTAALKNGSGRTVSTRSWLATSARCLHATLNSWRRVRTGSGDFLVQTYRQHGYSYDVCARTPDGRFVQGYDRDTHERINPTWIGGYYPRDSLGHLFLKEGIGASMDGFIVMLFHRTDIHFLEYGSRGTTLLRNYEPYRIRVTYDDCKPNCADGTMTHRTLVWRPSTQNYN